MAIINIDITLSTKIHLVKAMVFPEVMYGCAESTKAQSECLEASDKKELRMKRWREGESITQSCADHAEGFCCYLE